MQLQTEISISNLQLIIFHHAAWVKSGQPSVNQVGYRVAVGVFGECGYGGDVSHGRPPDRRGLRDAGAVTG